MYKKLNPEFTEAMKFDWKNYFEKGKAGLKRELESNKVMWNNFTTSNKRYALVSTIHICENNINVAHGAVTNYIDTFMYGGSPEVLEMIWNSAFYQQRFDSTTQHFIIDNETKTVVKFLSVCI